jgi:hypothetical protein
MPIRLSYEDANRFRKTAADSKRPLQLVDGNQRLPMSRVNVERVGNGIESLSLVVAIHFCNATEDRPRLSTGNKGISFEVYVPPA